MHATESFTLSNKAAGTYAITPGGDGTGGANSGRPWLMGGRYMMTLSGTAPTSELKILGPDQSTYLDIFGNFNNAGTEADLIIGKLGAAGAKTIDLAPGIYEVILGGSAIYFGLTRVPVSN